MGSVEIQGVCLICCKNVRCPPYKETELANCFKLLLRQLGLDDGNNPQNGLANTDICDDCCTLLENYGRLYNQWKCLELQLSRRIDKLHEIMQFADRVPSRVISFKNYCAGTNKNRDWNRFRKKIKHRCKAIRRNAMPRVYLRKIEVKQEVGGEEYSHDKTHVPILYGWLTSLLAVMMLSCLVDKSYCASSNLMGSVSDQTEDIDYDIDSVFVLEYNKNSVLTLVKDEEAVNAEDIQSLTHLGDTCQDEGTCGKDPLGFDSQDENPVCTSRIQVSTSNTAGMHRFTGNSQNTDSPIFTHEQTCDFCGKAIQSNGIFYHMFNHVGGFTLKCPNSSCRFVFSYLNSMRSHLRASKVCKSFMKKDFTKCDVCDIRLETLRTLKDHLTQVHEEAERKQFVCPVANCSETFAARQSVHFLVRSHTCPPKRERAVEISVQSRATSDPGVCYEIKERTSTTRAPSPSFTIPEVTNTDMDTSSSQTTNQQGKVVLYEKQRPFVCHHCGRRFKQKWSLCRHNKWHDIRCHVCRAWFKTPYMLKRHMFSHMEGAFKCDKCRRQFHTGEELETHLISHDQPINTLVQSESTSATNNDMTSENEKFNGSVNFVRSEGVVNVIRIQQVNSLKPTSTTAPVLSFPPQEETQAGDGTFQADGSSKEKVPFALGGTCDEDTRDRTSLEELENNSQLKEKTDLPTRRETQTCDFCRRTIKRSQLFDHMYNHLGEYTLKCPNSSCGSVFSLFSTLKRHLSGSKICSFFITKDLSTCNICHIRFNNLGALRYHLEMEHEAVGKQQFQCPVGKCRVMMATRQYVQVHIQVHTRQGPQQPPENLFQGENT